MVKKSFLLIILSVFIFLACGCTQGESERSRDDMSIMKKVDNWQKL